MWRQGTKPVISTSRKETIQYLFEIIIRFQEACVDPCNFWLHCIPFNSRSSALSETCLKNLLVVTYHPEHRNYARPQNLTTYHDLKRSGICGSICKDLGRIQWSILQVRRAVMASTHSAVLKLVARILNFLAAAIASDDVTEGHDVISSMAGLAASSQGPTQPTASASSSTSQGVPRESQAGSTPSPAPHPSSSQGPTQPTASASSSTSHGDPRESQAGCGCPLVIVTVLNSRNHTGKYHKKETCGGLQKAGQLTTMSRCSALQNGQEPCSICYPLCRKLDRDRSA